MMELTNILLRDIDTCIKNNDMNGLVDILNLVRLYDINKQISTGYIFQKSFFKACKYGNKSIILWLSNIFDEIDPIEKMSIRQLFKYGKYIVKRHKNGQLDKWYQETIISR